MVSIPGGTFTMGCDPARRPAHLQYYCINPAERPPHVVTLSAFEIDRTEVTQREYQRCIDAGSCTRPRARAEALPFMPVEHPEFPVGGVTWEQASQFCAWAGKRLPTEAEWEMAARGSDQRIYPWGNTAPVCNQVLMTVPGCPRLRLGPVGRFPTGASPYGVLDMEGGVSEWTADWYSSSAYTTGPFTNPVGPPSGRVRVVRGGSAWAMGVSPEVVTNRVSQPPDFALEATGIRCARSSSR